MMRDGEVISNRSAAGACRALGTALGCVLGVMLALLSGAAGVHAQEGSAGQSSTDGRTPAASAQKTRSRRVAVGASSIKKDNDGTVAPTGKGARAAATTQEASAGTPEPEDEPPATENGTGGRDRVGALRAQIKAAGSEAERARLRRTLVDYLVALDQKKEAVNELRLMLREERVDPVGYYNIGNALARLGDTDTAIDAYRKAIDQRHGHYARALNNLGVVLLRQGRWDEALEAFTSALRQEADRYPEASYNLGRLYSLRGEADLAIREWNRVLALQPDHSDAVLGLARAYAEDGNPERALAVIDALIARRGSSKELAAARREILSGADADEASSAPGVAPSGTSSSGASTKVYTSTRVATNNSGETPKAKPLERNTRPAASALLRSLTVDRETYDLLGRARAAREAGKDQEAISIYQRVLARRGGFFPPANLEISFVLANLDRREEAIASLQKLIAREGARYPVAYFHFGRQYEMLGQLGLAAEAYGRAVAAYGEREPQFLLDVSRVREKEGNIAAALAAMEEYARVSERHGHTPEWTAERISQLRQKKEAAAAAKQQSSPPRP